MAKTGGTKRVWRLEGLIAVLVIAVVAVLITMLVTNGSKGDNDGNESLGPNGAQQGDSEQKAELADSIERRDADDPMARGRVDAPVVLVEFEDFRCPFCAKFATDTAPELIDRYVDKGELRIEWRDYPIFGDKSTQAAKAGRAAAEQDKFWEFHDGVFADAPSHGHPDLPMDELVEHAEDADIDIDKFKSDMKDSEIKDALDSDISLGTQIGVQSTPAFFINGEPIMGAQPLDTFVDMIDKAKEQAE